MQDWTEAYKEWADLISKGITDIQWVDMWYNQTEVFGDEYPFGLPAVFIDIGADNIQTIGNQAQDINAQIGFFLAFETLADTYEGAWNQDSALAFNRLLTELHKLLQNRAGENFSAMNRVAIQPVDTGTNVLVYRIVYDTIIRDYSASPEFIEVASPGMTVKNEKGDDNGDDDPLFDVTT